MFKRLSNLFRGFIGLFVGGLERKNPEALLDVEKENLRRQIGEFNRGLAAHAALVERLVARVRKLEAEEKELRARTKALLNTGNREGAADAALKLQTVDREHDELARQMAEADTRYKEMLRARDVSVKAARGKIEGLRRSIDDMKVQKAMAELNEMAAGMVTTIGGSGDTLDRLGEMVEDERTKAAGRARVSRDSLDLKDFVSHEAEQKALADLALADFAAEEGIALQPNVSPAPEPTRESTSSATPRTPVSEGGSGTMGPAVDP